jgi:uncharacterized protein (TIGR02145 family)
VGADNVADSCRQRTGGAQNWQTYFKDKRDSKTYRVVLMPGNIWWMADVLDWEGTGSVCGGKRMYSMSEMTNACPEGWTVPSLVQADAIFALGPDAKAVGSCSECGGATDKYGLSLYPYGFYNGCSTNNGGWLRSSDGNIQNFGCSPSWGAPCNARYGSYHPGTTLRCVKFDGTTPIADDDQGIDSMQVTVEYGKVATLRPKNVAQPTQVSWYSKDGNLLLANSLTYTSTEPVKVYAQVTRGSVTVREMGVVSVHFLYTGAPQQVALSAGEYRLEAWGAQGSKADNTVSYGQGGYAAGDLNVTGSQTLHVYVGGQGGAPSNNGEWNGGWNGGGHTRATNAHIGGGGGATDFRLVGGSFDDLTSLTSRIMVAGGGGGSHSAAAYEGGVGGGLQGGLPAMGANDFPVGSDTYARQTASGSTPGVTQAGSDVCNRGSRVGRFGLGGAQAGDGNWNQACWGGGGGGGWYGGYGGGGTGGNGGSSYISGHAGCVAVESCTGAGTGVTCTHRSGCTDGTTDYRCSEHASGITFTNTTMIDGAGYAWTTAKGSLTSMPSPYGGSYQPGFLFFLGNGVAKITPQ